MKRIALVLVLVLALGLSACSQNPTPATQPVPSTQATQPTESTGATQETEGVRVVEKVESIHPHLENALDPADLGTYEGTVEAELQRATLILARDHFNVAQGACSDGQYFYVILESQVVPGGGSYKENDHLGKIYKLDAVTMKPVLVSEGLAIDHGNDITYNSKLGLLVVIHNAPNRKYLSYVDPDTLEVVETVKDNELEMYGIAYNEKTDKYVVGISHGYDFAILDGQLNVEKTFTGKNTGWTKQGIECDENFVYFLQYNQNAVVIYDWEGNYIRTVMINGVDHEPEAIFLLNGRFYMTSYMGNKQGARIYALDFVPVVYTPVAKEDFGTFEGEIIGKIEELGQLPADEDFNIMQGGCSDDTYLYLALESWMVNGKIVSYQDAQQNDHCSKIYKIDPKTLEVVQVSDPLPIDHCNDITYNATKDLLVVSHNSPNRKHLSYVDPHTLELVETIKDNELEMYGITYNEARDTYVLGISYGFDFAFADGELNVQKVITGHVTGWTKQTVSSDDNFIYFLQYKQNAVVVYDWEGNYVRTIMLDWSVDEPEALFLLDGEFYMSTYRGSKNGGRICKVSFVAKE